MKRFGSQPLWFALAIILALGAFVRFYQFEPWLHFELDQARDAKVIDEAFSGNFLDLPLLGPKAGGTFLRLGPAYYYLQYLSGIIFGQDPAGIAFIVPLLSLLAIPVFYVFMRRAFRRSESILLTLLFSVSVYVVMYARFAWNPNLLIFFVTAGFYTLLRAVDKNEPYKGRYFLGAVFLLTVATQFHFLAFLALPIITGAFLLLKRAWFSWRYWLGAVAIAIFLYFPMVLNEWEAGFTNTQEFLGAITEKSSKEEHNIFEKAVRNISEYSQHGIIILSGFEESTVPAVIIQPDEFGTVCDAKCDQGKWFGILGLLLLIGALGALVWARFGSQSREARDVYDLAIIWFIVSFMLFLPLSYGTAPRFYLLVVPLFFILLGSLLTWVGSVLPIKYRLPLFILTILLLVASNLHFLTNRFSELSRAATENVDSKPDRILKEQIRVTLEQERAVVDFLKIRQQETGYPIYMFSDPQYRRALKYLMERDGIQNDVLGFSGVYSQGEYYLVLRQRGDFEPALRKYKESYEVVLFKPFGTLMVVQLIPKPGAIQGERQDFSILENPADSKAPPRYTWREFFARQNPTTVEEEPDDEATN